MKYVRLGKSELKVSRVGFGGIPIMRISFEQAEKCILTAIELGINYIDTATDYGNSEEKIGRAIKTINREKLVIATKSPPRDAKRLAECIDQSLRRLQIETIDLYQFHCINNEEVLKRAIDLLPILEKAKEKGKIRHIGATVHGVEFINKVLDLDAFETIMIALNFIVREAADVALPNARKKDVGVIAMKPMAGGHIENANLAFKYFLNFEDIVPLVGIQSPKEIRQVVKILNDNIPASQDEVNEMEKIRREQGDRFCRRCEYCMPCEHGVKIFPMTIFKSFAARFPTKDLVTGNWVDIIDSYAKCIQCGECEKKCPYNLEIREILKENAAYFKELQSQFI
ncbi:MAG: aldo/keto reductase [Sedimentisphaerales bacterium]|nr:aldo/keto reductase [Sedimentisphaerales bacterium]